RAQLNEETSLRGYLITKDRSFLEPALSGVDPFEERAADLRGQLTAAGLDKGREPLDHMQRGHTIWRTDVMDPLVRNAATPARDRIEAYGKVATDRISREAGALRALVSAKNDEVEADLAANIDRTVDYAIGFVLIFALAGFYLTFAQHNTML